MLRRAGWLPQTTRRPWLRLERYTGEELPIVERFAFVLKETFDKAKLAAEIEVYQGAHGWCPPDTLVYNEPAAEKAWSRMLALYGKALA